MMDCPLLDNHSHFETILNFLGESMIFLNHKSHKHTMIWMYVLQRSQKNEVSIIFINGWNWNCAKNFVSKKKCTKAPSSTETPPKSDLKDWNVNTTSISATYLSRHTAQLYLYLVGPINFFFWLGVNVIFLYKRALYFSNFFFFFYTFLIRRNGESRFKFLLSHLL